MSTTAAGLGAASLGGLALPKAALAASASGTPDGATPQDEAPLMPDLPIIDGHHHLLDFPATATTPERRYLLPDLLADINASGQRILATVAVEDYAMYRADGPVELRSLGETEFINGVAAMSASGLFGPCRVASGIVAFADLRLGERVRPILQAHMAVAGGRLRGIRSSVAWDAYPIFGKPLDPARAALLRDPSFRKGVAELAPMGLVFDAFCFHTQLDDLTDLAGALPGTTVVLNHLGTPLGVGPYAGRHDEIFALWKTRMKALASRPNVVVKVGGMGMPMYGLPSANRKPRSTSAVLAEEWRPLVQTTIDLFGVHRCMFESNYPPDSDTVTYGGIWNTFKRITAAYSPDQRAALFSGTANRVYSLGIDVNALPA